MEIEFARESDNCVYVFFTTKGTAFGPTGNTTRYIRIRDIAKVVGITATLIGIVCTLMR